jgi:SNF2 family DNA or RNA helicase
MFFTLACDDQQEASFAGGHVLSIGRTVHENGDADGGCHGQYAVNEEVRKSQR